MELRPLTKEAVTSLNNHSMAFEDAASLFGVDLPTFKAKLLEFDIFVWKDPYGLRQRIHGGDYQIPIAFDKLRERYVVSGTLAFSDVVKTLEHYAGLPPEDYELYYEHPRTAVYSLLKTDRDWHNAVEYSNGRGYYVRLDVKTDDPDIVARSIAAFDEDASDDSEDASDDSEDASDCAPYGDVEIGNGNSLAGGGAYYGGLMPLTILSGDVEIGNGNSLAGGGAYYGGLMPLTILSGNEKNESGHTASSQKSTGQQGNDLIPTQQPVEIKKCSGCGGSGADLVQSCGYCSHCTQVPKRSVSQLLSMFQATNDASISKPRSNVKPLTGKGNAEYIG